MSLTTCALSGQPLVTPVVSVKSGHVFEKDLIMKHLSNTGQCPLTGADLSPQDLIPLTVPPLALPRPLVSTSIPGLLQLFHTEWDSVMLEVHQMRQSLESTRRELSQALYQHDAACRVIARLSKEKEELQKMLQMSNERVEEYKSQLAS
jgi:pre-mRNA-processing factor 19